MYSQYRGTAGRPLAGAAAHRHVEKMMHEGHERELLQEVERKVFAPSALKSEGLVELARRKGIKPQAAELTSKTKRGAGYRGPMQRAPREEEEVYEEEGYEEEAGLYEEEEEEMEAVQPARGKKRRARRAPGTGPAHIVKLGLPPGASAEYRKQHAQLQKRIESEGAQAVLHERLVMTKEALMGASEARKDIESGRSVHFMIKEYAEILRFSSLLRAPSLSAAYVGVRDPESCDFIKNMKLGDQCAFYQLHARQESGVVGIVEVVKEAYPDPTQFDKESPYYDPNSSKQNPQWFAVDIRAIKACETVVHLDLLRRLKKQGQPVQDLIHNLQQRHLYVIPLEPEEFDLVIAVAEEEMEVE